jgi:hypothetical protein
MGAGAGPGAGRVSSCQHSRWKVVPEASGWTTLPAASDSRGEGPTVTAGS